MRSGLESLIARTSQCGVRLLLLSSQAKVIKEKDNNGRRISLCRERIRCKWIQTDVEQYSKTLSHMAPWDCSYSYLVIDDNKYAEKASLTPWYLHRKTYFSTIELKSTNLCQDSVTCRYPAAPTLHRFQWMHRLVQLPWISLRIPQKPNYEVITLSKKITPFSPPYL